MKTCELAKAIGISWGACNQSIKRGMPTVSVEQAIAWRTNEHARRSESAYKWNEKHPKECNERNKKSVEKLRKWEENHPEEVNTLHIRSGNTLGLWRKNHPKENIEKAKLAGVHTAIWMANHPQEMITRGKALAEKGLQWMREHPQERKEKWMSTLKKSWIARRGSHGYGKVAMGNLNHARAKLWTIQSPNMKLYTFQNLMEWCRENEHLFDDDKGEYKYPLYRRAANGIDGKPSWRGWIAIERGEILQS